MSAQLKGTPLLRPMRAADVERVVHVERDIYEFPWTRGNFFDSLRARYHSYVYELDGVLVGYGIVSTGAGEAHLLNLSIAAEWQRRGHGRTLLQRFLDAARSRGARSIILEVRPTNTRAQRIYEIAGFRVIGVRPGYYPAVGGREDALVMERPL
jgi:ribosomal-protein-alanine N-acetyltransferase